MQAVTKKRSSGPSEGYGIGKTWGEDSMWEKKKKKKISLEGGLCGGIKVITRVPQKWKNARREKKNKEPLQGGRAPPFSSLPERERKRRGGTNPD